MIVDIPLFIFSFAVGVDDGVDGGLKRPGAGCKTRTEVEGKNEEGTQSSIRTRSLMNM